MADIDHWIEVAKQCKYLPENDLKKLCDMVCELLLEESNVQPVQTPVTVCGDIHGQFYDLMELFRTGGEMPDTNYVFMGDFVDRGYFSLETFTLLLTLKAKWPDKIVLLRGNHESRQITQIYGFYGKFLNTLLSGLEVFIFIFISFQCINKNYFQIIDEVILCVHGGLSPDIKTIDQIRTIERNQEIPHKGAFCGKFFCSGYKFMFDEKLVTVWSAPNYCYRCGNIAAVLSFSDPDHREAKLFRAVPDSERVIPPRNQTPYFL
uniref:Serine/threonine-protein phosphatase n=1 Tax=Biomphalaria glabrata TaxID=6526 RepID=A0A2C9JUS8_BIOGL